MLRLFMLLVLAVAATVCRADGVNEAMFRLQSTIQRLTQENAELQQKNNELTGKLTAAEAQVKQGVKGRSGDEQRGADFAAARARLESNNAVLLKASQDARQRILETMAQQRETQAQLTRVQAERDQTNRLVTANTSRMQMCEANNVALHDVGLQLIGEYERKGLWTVLAAREPVTQLKRAQLENLMDGYRQKIAELYRDIGGVPVDRSTQARDPPAATSGQVATDPPPEAKRAGASQSH